MRKLVINIDFIIDLYNTLNNECTICCSKGFDLGFQAQFFTCGKYDATRADKICNQVICSPCTQTIIKGQLQPTCIGCNSEINDVQLMDMETANGKNYYSGPFKEHMKKATFLRFTQEYDLVIKLIVQRNKIFDTLGYLKQYMLKPKRVFNPSKCKTEEIMLDAILSFYRQDARHEIIKAYARDPKEGDGLLKILFTSSCYQE